MIYFKFFDLLLSNKFKSIYSQLEIILNVQNILKTKSCIMSCNLLKNIYKSKIRNTEVIKLYYLLFYLFMLNCTANSKYFFTGEF